VHADERAGKQMQNAAEICRLRPRPFAPQARAPCNAQRTEAAPGAHSARSAVCRGTGCMGSRDDHGAAECAHDPCAHGGAVCSQGLGPFWPILNLSLSQVDRIRQVGPRDQRRSFPAGRKRTACGRHAQGSVPRRCAAHAHDPPQGSRYGGPGASRGASSSRPCGTSRSGER